MEDGSIVIPFFALGANILPGEPLPLHIFEPQYKKMLEYCLGDNEHGRPLPFGLSLSRPRVIEPIGCSVQIASVIQKYQDGRSMILTMGEHRFRLLETNWGGDFPKARIRFIEDLDEPVDSKLRAEVVELFCEAIRVNLISESGPECTSEHISYKLAARVNLEQAERQDLLNQPSEQARLEKLSKYLKFQLTTAKYAQPHRMLSFIQ